MPPLTLAFAFSSFAAGFLMFLAPCTLPLIPAYIAFISGVKEGDIPKGSASLHRHVIANAFAFVLGFSLIFISFGLLAGMLGMYVGPFHWILTKVGGIMLILFGLLMLNVFKKSPLLSTWKMKIPKSIHPGKKYSSFLIGAIFALGWTPCIGPILASILFLASVTATAYEGAILLALFSFGLSIPFVLTAVAFVRMSSFISKYSYLSEGFNWIGGIFLIGIGMLLLTGQFGLTLQYGSSFFEFFGLGGLLKFY